MNRLIRESRAEPAPGFTRPTQETILAYLMGTATAEQEKLVRKALLESRTFSDEILCMARDIESLDRERLLEQKKSPVGIAAPELADFLRRHEPDREARATGSFLSRLQWLLVPRRLVPIAASALAVLTFLIVRMATGPVPQIAETTPPSTAPVEVAPITVALATWNLVNSALDPGYLQSNITRGAETPQLYSNAKEAAVAKIAYLLEPVKGGFRPKSIEKMQRPEGAYRTVMLICNDVSGNHIKDIVTYIPSVPSTARPRITAWALTLPARNLYNLPMKSDTITVLFSKDMPADACIVFTYAKDKEQKAIPGYSLEKQ
ncbi:MAG: hypothetical protein NTW97_05910 [Candidatus Krumholzibacteria bacterium]|nr:hypothetical protein [Candidatus Krumholzibacteria bacterium]